MRWVLRPLLLCLGTSASADFGAVEDDASPRWTGRAILERAQENWRADTLTRVRLRAISRSGRSIEHHIEAARRSIDGRTRTLVRLTHPPELRDVTLLIIENDERAEDVFLYLPVRRRVLRIPAPRRNDRFLGTDLQFNHLGGSLDLSGFRLARLPAAPDQGEDEFVIRAESENSQETRSYRVSRRTFVVLGVEYERNGRTVRRLEVDPDSVRRIGEDAWIPTRLVMRNLVSGTRTELEVTELEVDPDLPDELFSVSRLERLARRGLPKE